MCRYFDSETGHYGYVYPGKELKNEILIGEISPLPGRYFTKVTYQKHLTPLLYVALSGQKFIIWRQDE